MNLREEWRRVGIAGPLAARVSGMRNPRGPLSLFPAVDEKLVEDDLAEWAFRRHYGQVYRYLLRRSADRQQAEELTQEVFADAASALQRFRPGATPVLALLYTLAQRRFADAARRNARTSLVPVDEVVGELVARDYDAALADAIRRAIGRLPRQQAVVVTMKLVHGCSFAEIAAELAVSEEACKKRFVRALAVLRRELAQEGFEP